MRHPGWIPWIAAILIALASLPAGAQEPLARLNISGANVDWMVNGSHERVVLTVSDPEGKVTRHEVKSNKPLSFNLFDAKGNKKPDGVYHWELRADPVLSAAVKEQLAASRRSGDASVELNLRKSGQLPTASVLSGAFTIAGGSFVENDLTGEQGKSPAIRAKATSGSGLTPMFEEDQEIAGDLIIQGSACIGLDCVNNESFGSETSRLKANNTRIMFDDTSSTGFPANDWQLTANDSASGGSSKFAIEDITGAKVPFTITAGAATNSIFVDSTGRLGLRTSTPVLDIHIATSNTPSIRLEQTSAGGLTAQTWDIGGNEASFFVRDVTSALPFRIRPGAPTSSIDISANGDVGIGTASPAQKLHIEESADANTIILSQNTNGTGTAAAGVVRATADIANTSFIAHGSARTLVRFGETLGGWNELIGTAGDGLIVGTAIATPLILGTNSTKRIQIGATGGVTVTGNFTVTGGTKNFAMVDPTDPKKAIYFAALEGPEAGTYFRGTAKTVDGKVVIDLPSYFSKVTETTGITVQLTPSGRWSQLYVEEKTPERLVVRVTQGNPDVEFDFFVQGIRAGYNGFQVERPNEGNIQ
ncbi:MAG TPA: hypothetical protein VLQ45_35110 [Thermoanaerobaculia bacterium]|nr:hypothetical protein [Thermoanaerobaculia bacterium]